MESSFSVGFKVPKLKSKECLQKISLNDHEFRTSIYQRLVESYVQPKQSEKVFQIVNGWLINNINAEHRYVARRQSMRKENPSFNESIGFIYLKSKDDLIELARSGRVRVGNIVDSHLGQGKMGISICQHADVYHPGNNISGIPKGGYIAIVKYLKGKINFVRFDSLPLEPQPQFDSHMLKNWNAIDKSFVIYKAFHMTQVFIYEYSEDGDIIDYPSQILPLAIVEFKWSGPYIFRISSQVIMKPKFNENTISRITSAHVEKLPIKQTEPKRPLRLEAIDTSVHKKDSTFSLPCQLVFNNDQHKNEPELKINSTVYMYLTNPVIFPQLYVPQWKITNVIEINEFEKELKLFQFHLQDKITKSNTDLLDPLSNDIIISINGPTLLTISENKMNEPFLLSNDTTIPKFITYLRIVPDLSQESRHCAFKLIDHFNNSKTIARISLGSIGDQCKTILFIFPDGKLSQKLGIPSVKANKYYFHGLLLHYQHPEFSLCCLNKESTAEKLVYFTCLNMYRKQAFQVKFGNLKSLIDTEVLKQTCNDQAIIQKEMFSHILKPNSNKPLLRYPSLQIDKNSQIQNVSDAQSQSISDVVDKEILEKGSSQSENIVTPIISEQYPKPSSVIISDVTSFDQLTTKLKHKDLDKSMPKITDKGSVYKDSLRQLNIAASAFNRHLIEQISKPLNDLVSGNPCVSKIPYDKPNEPPLLEKTNPKIPKKKKIQKRKISECEAINLKAKLYNMFKNPANLPETSMAVENNSIDQEDMESSSLSSSNTGPDSGHSGELDSDDLVPIRKKIPNDTSNNGSFSELIFVNQCYANIADSDRTWFVTNTPSDFFNRTCEYKRMWCLDRFIFRKVKHIAGISVYVG